MRTATRRRTHLTLVPGHSVVLHHDDDRGLTYTWWDVSPDRQDAGPRESAIETSLLAVTDPTGQRVAHLRISFTTAAMAAVTFPRPLYYADENRGWCLGLISARQGYRDPLTSAELWANAHRAADAIPASLTAAGRFVPSFRLTADQAPADAAVLEADLAVLERPLRRELRAWIRWHQVPYVAYSFTDEAIRGTGIGRRMYLLAAQHLATTGRVLCASGIRSNDALALWARLEADRAVPTVTVIKVDPRTRERREYVALDYRRI